MVARTTRPRERRREARLLLAAPLVTLLVTSGCAREPADWSPLVRSSPPQQRPDVVQLPTTDDGHRARIVAAEDTYWIETRIRAADWTEAHPGTWTFAVPFESESTSASIARHRLVGDERDYTNLAKEYFGEATGIEPGMFLVAGGRVHLQLEEGEEPPDELVYRFETNLSDARPWHRLHDRDLAGDGFTLLPDEEHVLPLEPGGPRTLRFLTYVEGGSAAEGRGRFEIELDGEALLAHDVDIAPGRHLANHAIELPEGAAGELRFRYDGPLTHAAILAPVVGPADIGTRGARPWGDARPDLVLFVADTLRADCLAAYGGDPTLMPETNALFDESLVFERAWSTSTWTLPTHATLFSGLHPRQANAIEPVSALPRSLDTVAEILRDHGYRTIGISDGGYVSPSHGLAQGFELFVEVDDGMENTLALAQQLLEADDGRPTFLFVQTYQVHTPYDVSEETRRTHGAALGIPPGADYEELQRQMEELGVLDPDMLDVMRSLYLGGAVDLDAYFARFLALLRREGLLPGGKLVYVSDHGEAFGEHGRFGHGGRGIEAIARVPLAVFGVEPGVRSDAVSLVDVAPTLLALAGIAVPTEWVGRSLLDGPNPDDVLLTWGDAEHPFPVGVVDDGQKLYVTVPEDGAPTLKRAFDLESDPKELEDLEASGDVRRLPTDVVDSVLDSVESRAPSEASELGPERRAELQALGYGGD